MLRSVAGLVLSVVVVSGQARAFVWPSTVDRVGRDLGAADVALRRRAARRLVDLPQAAVKRLGPAALDDPDPDVRIAALEALLGASRDGLAARVVSWLGDGDLRVRRAAADALGRLPFAPAVPALGRILADPDLSVRVAAARALGASGESSAVVPLLGRLDDTEAEVREAVVTALSRIGDRGAVVPLVGKIQDSRPSVRRDVARALGALGDVRASSALELALRDADDSVRVAALGALSRLHATDAVATVVALLDEERRPAVREAALAALAEIPSDAGLDALVRALSTDDPREKSPVRDALVVAGARALPKLLLCLVGQPSLVQADGCALALGEIGGPGVADAIGAALRRGVVRPEAALRALSQCRDARALGTVLEYLSSEDPWVRRSAVEAASALLDPALPDGRAVEPLVRALDAAHGRRAERAALVALLGKTGSPRATPVLVGMVAATDPMLRIAALNALAMVGPAGQDRVLLDALDDERAPIRLAAAEALRRTGGSSAAPVLLDRLERSAEQDRGALGLALLGPLAATSDPVTIARAAELAARSVGGDRDALIEALGATPKGPGGSALQRLLAGGADAPTRAKIAEAFGTHPEEIDALGALLHDPDPSVRANAAWSIGALGRAEDIPSLEGLLEDRDPAVAGDAAGAVGRLGRSSVRAEAILCSALLRPGPYVRMNALAGLRRMGSRCKDGTERALVTGDPFEGVRAAAALLVVAVPSLEVALDRAAVGRCISEDPSGAVAAACSAPPPAPTTATVPVSVYVTSSGAAAPAGRVPFALVRADGFVRLGLTDLRGAVYEHDAPPGPLRLAIPAPLLF